MRRLWISFLLFVLISCLGFAENRWVIDVKSGAGAGLIGLAVEKEWSGFSVWFAGGVAQAAVGYGIGLRFYFSPEAQSRGFAGAIVGGATTGQLSLPYGGAVVGYEWRLSSQLRVTVEGGLAFALFLPLPVFGLALGLIF